MYISQNFQSSTYSEEVKSLKIIKTISDRSLLRTKVKSNLKAKYYSLLQKKRKTMTTV